MPPPVYTLPLVVALKKTLMRSNLPHQYIGRYGYQKPYNWLTEVVKELTEGDQDSSKKAIMTSHLPLTKLQLLLSSLVTFSNLCVASTSLIGFRLFVCSEKMRKSMRMTPRAPKMTSMMQEKAF